MRIFIKKLLPLLLTAAFCIALGGCSKKVTDPKASASPSMSPMASPSQNALGRASESPAASPSAAAGETDTAMGTDGASESPDASGGPDASTGADTIEGFMEGVVVKPEDVPALVKLLAGHDDYKDMSIQSITYKLYEGRQAYYVILQGEGEASHPVYVFADDTVLAESAE